MHEHTVAPAALALLAEHGRQLTDPFAPCYNAVVHSVQQQELFT
jgi:hypothetical protein